MLIGTEGRGTSEILETSYENLSASETAYRLPIMLYRIKYHKVFIFCENLINNPKLSIFNLIFGKKMIL